MKKKTALAAVCLLLAALMFSCSKPKPEEAAEGGGVARLITTEYPSKTVYAPHIEGGARAPEVGIITSRQELIRYVSLYEGAYDFADATRTTCLYDVVTLYDETFFTANSLVVLVLTAKSAATELASEGIGKTDGGFEVRVRSTTPAGAIPGEADWHIFLEVPAESLFLLEPEKIGVRLVESLNY